MCRQHVSAQAQPQTFQCPLPEGHPHPGGGCIGQTAAQSRCMRLVELSIRREQRRSRCAVQHTSCTSPHLALGAHSSHWRACMSASNRIGFSAACLQSPRNSIISLSWHQGDFRQRSTGDDTSRASDMAPSVLMGSVLLGPILRNFSLSTFCLDGYDASQGINAHSFHARKENSAQLCGCCNPLDSPMYFKTREEGKRPLAGTPTALPDIPYQERWVPKLSSGRSMLQRAWMSVRPVAISAIPKGLRPEAT